VAGPITSAALRDHLEVPDRQVPRDHGGAVPATSLVRDLLRRGHRVVVATLSRDVADEVVLEGPALRIHVGPYRPQHRARDGFKVERHAVRRALQQERPDVVHAQWSYEYALGALASGVPTMVTLHDWAPTILGFNRDAYRAVRLGMHAVTMARARHLTAVSPYLQEAAARWRREAHVVPNGLADRWFTPGPRELHRDAPVLVSVNAGFGERKNTTTLLRAFGQLRERHPAARLVLIGDGHQGGGPAKRWAEDEGLLAGVEFRGRQPYQDTMAAMGAADLLVHSSLEESFGMTLIEAMAQGTPVVGGARSGAVPWVLDQGAAGALADVTSAASLCATMDRVLADPVAWQGWSTRGYERASTAFRLSRVVDRYLELYDEVARAPR
jgi:L-malate glycosyltransferase